MTILSTETRADPTRCLSRAGDRPGETIIDSKLPQ